MSQVLLIADQLLEWLSERTRQSISNCFFTHTNARLQIRDQDVHNTPCVFEECAEETDEIFRIDNPSEKVICFLAVDQCILGNDGSKRCDCVVFDEHCLCFVELKLNVTKARQGADRSKEAREQLAHTITYFKDLGYLIDKHELEAYIAMRSYVYPRSSNRNVREKFFMDNGVPLFEQNWKKF
jgi:hypothetical protein